MNFKARAVDTDATSSREAGDAAIEFLLIGRDRLLGNGTGGDVASGKVAADDDLNKLEPYLSEVRMVMVVTSLGSGTGGGATPKILSFLKERGLTTFCFATMPLAFEGDSRIDCANAVLPLVQDSSDTLVTVPLDDLAVESGTDNLQLFMEEALKTLSAGVSLIWRMLCSPGYIQLDSERMRSLVMNGRNARLGFASSSDTFDRASSIVQKLFD
jgi:cell division protein FtsZ